MKKDQLDKIKEEEKQYFDQSDKIIEEYNKGDSLKDHEKSIKSAFLRLQNESQIFDQNIPNEIEVCNLDIVIHVYMNDLL